MSLLGALEQKYQEQKARLNQSVARAKEWFSKTASMLGSNAIMNINRERLVPRANMSVRSIGRMYLFFYDPKLKKKLPYYDIFPLVIPIRFYKDGFLGLNLHYLPYDLRARLLDGLYTIYHNKQLDENRKLNLTYQQLKGSTRTRFFKPCIKRYLWKHCQSQFYQVDPVEWDMVLMLPVERFQKRSKSFVWDESRRKLGISTH